MASKTSHALTPEEAKTRLRSIALDLSPFILTQRHPRQAVVFALIGGYILSRVQLQSLLSCRRYRSLLWQAFRLTLSTLKQAFSSLSSSNSV